MGNAHSNNDDENDPTNSTVQPLSPPSVLSGLEVAAMCKIVTQPINDEERQLIHTLKEHITNHGGTQMILQRSISGNEVNNSKVPDDDQKMVATDNHADSTSINSTEDYWEISNRKRKKRRQERFTKKENERAEEREMAFITKCKESMGEKPREDEIVYWNCVGCGLFQREEMKKCPTCDWAIYCSEECFAEHWPVHQEICQNVEN